MTNTEAHEYIENLQRAFTRNRHLFNSKLIEANGISILALEKQMPRMIKIWNNQCYCPKCEKLFGDKKTIKNLVNWDMDYCKYCGQALDWKMLS